MTAGDDSMDAGLDTKALQEEEARRRLRSSTGNTIANDKVMAWLDTWGSGDEIPPPECE